MGLAGVDHDSAESGSSEAADGAMTAPAVLRPIVGFGGATGHGGDLKPAE